MKKSVKFLLYSFVFILIVGGFLIYYLKDNNNIFSNGVNINGIDVSKMNKDDAKNLVFSKLASNVNEIEITLNYKDKTYKFYGKDFEINNELKPYIDNVYNYTKGNLFSKITKNNKQKRFNFSYMSMLNGLNEKIESIASEIEVEPTDATFMFDAKQQNPLVFTTEQNGIELEKEKLSNQINNALTLNSKVELEIPTKTIEPQIKKEDLEKQIALRGSFSTSYKNSNADRKFNVRHALENFNGMQIKMSEEISFNETTGARTKENGYKKANIIVNGVYVEGSGGGVCQASTTLYNALLLADIPVIEVHKHTLPSSYVWLSFDAMVSEGTSDLRFVNNTEKDIFIKTDYDDQNVYVYIYGTPLKENEKLVRRVEFLGTIPHNGDRIIADVNHEYSNKVTYKGEYLRLKYPSEGYKAKAFIDRYIDDILVESKLIRDETYLPQDGIIIEGIEEVVDGITLPPNTVKFIPPQEKTTDEKDIQKKIEKENPSNLNP